MKKPRLTDENAEVAAVAKPQRVLTEAEHQKHQQKLKRRREVAREKQASLNRLANELIAQHETEIFVCVAGCSNKTYSCRGNIQRHTRQEHPALYKMYDRNRNLTKQVDETEDEVDEPADVEEPAANGLDEVEELDKVDDMAPTPKAKGTGKGRLEGGKKKKPAMPEEVRSGSLFWKRCPGRVCRSTCVLSHEWC